MTPSNANTSGLEVVAWRVKHSRHDAHRLCFVPAPADKAEPLVTAESAQAEREARLAADARADRLAKALEPFAAKHECDGHATVEDFNMEVQIFVRWAIIKEARAALQQEG